MVEVRAFRGLRYDPAVVGDIGAVLSPPYDALDADLLDALRRRSPYNLVHLERPADAARAAATLAGWRAEGILRVEPRPAVYVYRQAVGAESQRGILAALRLVPWGAGGVLPHEGVHQPVLAERRRVLEALRCNLSPVYLVYEEDHLAGVLDAVTATDPEIRAVEPEGATHELWVVTDPEAHALVARAFADVELLMADGHHRYTSAWELHHARRLPGSDAILVYLVSEVDGPRVGALHRVYPAAPADLAGRLRRLGLGVTPVSSPQPPGSTEHIVWVTGEGVWAVSVPGDHPLLATIPPAVRVFEAVVADTLAEHLGLGVPTVTPDAAAAVAAADGGAAVLLPPPRLGDIWRLARGGHRLPPKSTWFHPKPRAGLVLRAFEPE